MGNLKIIEDKNWKDFGGGKTEALSLDIDELYSISEFIILLEEAKKRWGDKKVVIHGITDDTIGGFSTIYLNKGYDYREEYGEDYYQDDKICIYG